MSRIAEAAAEAMTIAATKYATVKSSCHTATMVFGAFMDSETDFEDPLMSPVQPLNTLDKKGLTGTEVLFTDAVAPAPAKYQPCPTVSPNCETTLR